MRDSYHKVGYSKNVAGPRDATGRLPPPTQTDDRGQSQAGGERVSYRRRHCERPWHVRGKVGDEEANAENAEKLRRDPDAQDVVARDVRERGCDKEDCDCRPYHEKPKKLDDEEGSGLIQVAIDSVLSILTPPTLGISGGAQHRPLHAVVRHAYSLPMRCNLLDEKTLPPCKNLLTLFSGEKLSVREQATVCFQAIHLIDVCLEALTVNLVDGQVLD